MGINKYKFPYRALFGSKQLNALKKVFIEVGKINKILDIMDTLRKFILENL